MSRNYTPDLTLPDAADPFTAFATWFADAKESEPELPEAASLATVGASGRPSNRMVLVRGVGPDGFDFYTNYQSRKAREVEESATAALCFHWKSLGRQVRVEGDVTVLPPDLSDRYWASRPRGSQLGAWASDQSQTTPTRAALLTSLVRVTTRFEGAEIPRPPHWGGFRLVPIRIELWAGRPDRLHDRVEYLRCDTTASWTLRLLQP